MSAGRNIKSKSLDWGTPQKYVNALKLFFSSIDLDPCSNSYSIVGATVEYKLPKQNGLLKTWNYKNIYVNPPYGFDRVRKTRIRDWICRCHKTHIKYESEIIALIPVATNTYHWKNFIFGSASSICFLYDTRLKFLLNGSDLNKGAPMACCLVYWGKKNKRFFKVFKDYGAVVDIRYLKL